MEFLCTLENHFDLRHTLLFTTHLQLFGREMLINHNDVFYFTQSYH